MVTTTAELASSPLGSAAESRPTHSKPKRLPLIEHYLREQAQLTAVERFAQVHERWHETSERPAQAKYYRSLIPVSKPKSGQQYAFSVDLDRCSGCKACVTACHSLNGLDEAETWRSVGLLHGGSSENPLQQTVTTACHHCIEPACLLGCPVKAYEKDPVTGIVRHLDDQCIGCSYCTLTCPYEVPQFNKKLGIVRKCDMCSDRLAADEAPACVQGCPNEAIAIRIVDKAQIIEDVQADAFLPGAPSPGITLPTTEYKTRRAFPKNTLPADFYNVRPAHNHFPLVVLLVLTQLSVGAFSANYVVSSFYSARSVERYQALVALVLGLVALLASVWHLGRPKYAFRAIMGVRTSWMSREIACFGAFAGLAVAYAAGSWADPALAALHLPLLAPELSQRLQRGLGAAVVITGLVGVLCSAMLYAVTRRVFWQLHYSGPRFLGTSGSLGVAITLLVWCTAAHFGAAVPQRTVDGLWRVLLAVSAAKLVFDASIFRHLKSAQVSDLKRTARLMWGELGRLTRVRFALGIGAGVILPALALWPAKSGAEPASISLGVLAALALGCVGLIVAELIERSLFFMAAASPKMPGGIGK